MDIKYFFTLVLLAIHSFLFAQTKDERQIDNYLKMAKSISNVNIYAEDSLVNLAVKLCKKINNKRLIAECLLKRISVLQNIGDNATSHTLNKEVYSLCKKEGFSDLIPDCLDNDGIYYMLLEENIIAIDKLGRASNLFLKAKNYKKYINTTANLGWTYGQNRNYLVARHYLKEALEYAIKYTPNKLGLIYEKLAIQYAKHKYEYKDTAIIYFRLAEKEYKSDNDLYGLANIYNNLGSTFYLNNQFNEALINYNLALENYHKIGFEYAEKEIYMNLGAINTNLGNLVLAEKYLNQSMQIAKAENDKNTQTELLKSFAFLNEKKGDYKNAVKYYNQFITDYFLNYGEQQTNEINKLEKSNEIITKENKLILLRKEQAEMRLKYFIVSAIAFLIILLSIFLIIYLNKKNKREKQVMNIDFEQKSEMLIRYTTEEEHKRISRDLHDNIGSYAVSIMNSIELLNLEQNKSELTQHLNEIKSNASNVLNSIRETITVLNHKEFRLIKILDSFKSYATNILKNHLEIQFNVLEEISNNKTYSSMDSVNISYLLKEFFNNAIKHSECKTINFSVKEKEKIYYFELSDDGIGFDLQNYEARNGMENLKYRADKLKIEMKIVSAKNQGTKIQFSLV